MKHKKLITGCLSAIILSYTSIATLAAAQHPPEFINPDLASQSIMPIKAELNPIKQAYFNAFTGVVKEIKEHHTIKDAQFISVENSEGIPAHIIVSNKTYSVSDKKIQVGDTLTAYYDANAPMIMIFPAQYNAEVVVAHTNEKNIKVDGFDKELVSSDGMLKLHISDSTQVLSQDGKPFDGDLANRKLVVTYDISTKSLPAQTTPIQVVVLPQEQEAVTEPLPYEIAPIESTLDLIINGKQVGTLPAPVTEENTIMVPLRTAAEALGYDVFWDGQLRQVKVGQDIQFVINEDSYLSKKATPTKLGTAPQLVEETTFVPLSFFSEVLGIENIEPNTSKLLITSN